LVLTIYQVATGEGRLALPQGFVVQASFIEHNHARTMIRN